MGREREGGEGGREEGGRERERGREREEYGEMDGVERRGNEKRRRRREKQTKKGKGNEGGSLYSRPLHSLCPSLSASLFSFTSSERERERHLF